MTTYLHTGASIANFKAVQVDPGPNADSTAIIVIALGPYQLSFVGWNAASIANEWNTSANPFFQQITASTTTGTGLVFTSNILGQDFEITVSVNGNTGFRVSAIQSLDIRASGGTFTLTDGTVTSGAITYSATPATLRTNIQNAINAMTGYSAGDVTVYAPAVDPGTGPFTLDFSTGRFAGLSVAPWTATSSLTGGTALATITTYQTGNVGTNEIITISFPADGTHSEDLDEIQSISVGSATSGEFVLTLPTYGSTNSIPFTAGRSRIKTELENIVGLDNIIVSGGPLAAVTGTGSTLVEGTLTNDGQADGSSGVVITTWTPSATSILIRGATSDYNYGLFRFALVADQGDTIENAVFSVTRTSSGGSGTDASGTLAVPDADTTTWPTNTATASTLIQSAQASSLGIAYTLPAIGLAGEVYSFNITEIIQAIVDRAGWVSGNHITLVFLPSANNGAVDVDAIESTGTAEATLSCLISGADTYSYNPITVQFTGAVGGLDLDEMTASALATITTVQDGGTQTVPNINGGTWALLLNNPATGATYNVASIPYNVSAAALDTLIEAVCGVGTVTVTGGPAPSTPLVIQFTGDMQKTALTETVVASLTGNFGASSSLTTVREAITLPEVDNCWDMTVIPGEGTLAISSVSPVTSRGYLIMTIAEPDSINPASIIDNNIYIPLYNINPARIEAAINEAYGKDVVRVTRIVHSLEHAEIPAHTEFSSISTAATPLHFWYYRDIFRLVFVGDYQASGSIISVSVRIAPISNVNPAAASPALWMIATTTPASDDLLDLYYEGQRTYLGFTNYLSNPDAAQYHEFSCVRNSNVISNKLSYRAKLLTQFLVSGGNPGGSSSGETTLKRVGVARQIMDNTISFSWVKEVPTLITAYPPAYEVICSTTSLNWDSSADTIEAALSAMLSGFMASVTVTGTLYNSWLSEFAADATLPENSYHDLHITIEGKLAGLPLNELGYKLIASISPVPSYSDYRNPIVWIEPFSVPLPGGLNQRKRLTLASPASVTAMTLSIDNYTISGLTTSTTAAQLQALIAAAIGAVPAGGGVVTNNFGTPIPEKWRNPVTVYGTTLAFPVEIELSGFGYQYANHSISFGVTGVTTLITVVETQVGVNPVGEVQRLTISGLPHSGTYTVDGGANLTYNANAAALQANLGVSIPVVTGTYPNFTLTWPSSSGNVAQLTTTSSGLNNSFVLVEAAGTNAQAGGLGASATISDLTPGTGPLYLDSPQNYSPAAVFSSEDTLVIDDTLSAITFGLDMSSYFSVISLGAGSLFKYDRNRIVFQENQKVYLTGTGTPPAGLTFGNAYYVVGVQNNYLFQLSLTPSGAAIAVTDVGTGTFRLYLKNVILQVHSRYAGQRIGLPNNNTGTSLPEYLAKYLVLPGINADIGIGEGSGLNLLRLNSDHLPSEILIQQSAQSSTSNIPAVLLLSNNADTNLTILDGDVGIAVYSQETSLLHNITVVGGSITLHGTTVAGTLATSNGVTPVIQTGCTIAGVVTIE